MPAPCEKIVLRYSQLTPRSIDWLWAGRIAAGQLTLIDGDPNLGKSLLTLDLAARLSAGRAFPDGNVPPIPMAVLVLCAEDGQSETVRPRLQAASADLDRVHFFRCRAPTGRERWPAFPDDCDLLEETIRETDARLVVIDPLLAFLAPSICSLNHDLVRRVLEPLREVAERTRAAITMIRHLTKASQVQPALYRGTGATSIVGAARCAFLVAKHPEDPNLRLLAGIKHNLGPPPPTLAFRIASDAQGQPVIEWAGTVGITADELTAARPAEPSEPVERAMMFLRELLAPAPATHETVLRLARGLGIADRTLRRAKAQLHVRSEQHHEDGHKIWYWSLPPDTDSARIVNDLFPNTLASPPHV